ncbi:hypothetical protein AX15_001194 [Amanita polypyramis BW_CC]|nr:hypothetical protein AX15_001194 [Amanita polypyramis BW_CC]
MLVRKVYFSCPKCMRNVSTNSPIPAAVHRGTAFEERSLKLLQENLSMSLQRVGGKEDGGIDLQGWWWLPTSTPQPSAKLGVRPLPTDRLRLRVIAQCKAEKKKISPRYVRELEGVMFRFLALPGTASDVLHSGHANSTSENPRSQYPLVALLISESPFTKSTLLRAHSSPLPLFLLCIPPLLKVQREDVGNVDLNSVAGRDPDESVNFGSAFWNPALAGKGGVLGGEMEIRWERSPNENNGRPGIWWRDKKLVSWVPNYGIASDGTALDAQHN